MMVNVDHINAISLVLNKCCYFDIYKDAPIGASTENLKLLPLAIVVDKDRLDYYPIYKLFGGRFF